MYILTPHYSSVRNDKTNIIIKINIFINIIKCTFCLLRASVQLCSKDVWWVAIGDASPRNESPPLLLDSLIWLVRLIQAFGDSQRNWSNQFSIPPKQSIYSRLWADQVYPFRLKLGLTATESFKSSWSLYDKLAVLSRFDQSFVAESLSSIFIIC